MDDRSGIGTQVAGNLLNANDRRLLQTGQQTSAATALTPGQQLNAMAPRMNPAESTMTPGQMLNMFAPRQINTADTDLTPGQMLRLMDEARRAMGRPYPA
jgi:hypothetical protein